MQRDAVGMQEDAGGCRRMQEDAGGCRGDAGGCSGDAGGMQGDAVGMQGDVGVCIVDDQQNKEEKFTSTNISPGQSLQNFCSRMKLFPQA